MPSPGLSSFGRRVLAAVVLFGSLAIGLTACGASGSASGSTNSSSGAQFQARLNYAKCMRSHGIDIPDPTAGGGPAGGVQAFKRLDAYPQAKVQAAQQACGSYQRQAFGNDNQTPAQRAARRQQLVKFAECMRAHGINIPDPTPGQGGGFGIRQALRSIDFNSPAFKTATNACRGVAPPFFRGGGGPGGQGAVQGPAQGAPGA
jgi:hypothetical protein